MKDQENGKLDEQVVEPSPKVERRRQSEVDGEPGVVRIKLPAAVGVKAKEIVAELRARGAQVTLDELLAEYVEAIPPRYFEAQLVQRTPEPYYLEAAAKVPELREMLIRQAKKGLLRNSPPSTEPRAPRRSRRNLEESDVIVSRADVSNAEMEGKEG